VYLNDDEWIELILPDKMQRTLLEKRLQISPEHDMLTFAEWCKCSSLNSNLVKSLINVYVQPQSNIAPLFDKIAIQDIVQYIKSSHQYYNTYYLFQLDQFIDASFQNFIEPSYVLKLKRLIAQFNQSFRAHVDWEEKYPIPYIEFLDIQTKHSSHSLEECYAIISKFNLNSAAKHDSEQHALMNSIVEQIKLVCSKGSYDIQWQFYHQLLLRFQHDLSIHEFIEDKILFSKAQQLENQILSKIDERSILN
jgi:hypothetical protein